MNRMPSNNYPSNPRPFVQAPSMPVVPQYGNGVPVFMNGKLRVRFKGDGTFVPIHHFAQKQVDSAGRVHSISINENIDVYDISKKRTVVVTAVPAVLDENNRPKKLSGKKAKSSYKQDPDDNDIITVNMSGNVEFKNPPTYTRSGVLLQARPKRIFPFIILFLLLLLGLLGTFLLSAWDDPNARKGHYENKTEEEIQQDLNADVEWNSMMLSIAPYVVMSPGSPEAPDINVENIEANHCDQKFKILLKDTDEVLYESGAISPGEVIDDVTFNRSFNEGVYEAVVEFQGYEQDARIGGGGLIWGHDEFGAPARTEIMLIVTDDDDVARATADYYLQ